MRRLMSSTAAGTRILLASSIKATMIIGNASSVRRVSYSSVPAATVPRTPPAITVNITVPALTLIPRLPPVAAKVKTVVGDHDRAEQNQGGEEIGILGDDERTKEQQIGPSATEQHPKPAEPSQ
jgi:hypothetical protein